MSVSCFSGILRRMVSATLHDICALDECIGAQVTIFIQSWSAKDAHDRFGSAGIGAEECLIEQLRRQQRHALVAVNDSGVIGLLDYVTQNNMTYLGIVVDARFRKMCIATTLVRTLLLSAGTSRPFQAECANRNDAAAALLRGCGFTPVATDRYDTTWRRA